MDIRHGFYRRRSSNCQPEAVVIREGIRQRPEHAEIIRPHHEPGHGKLLAADLHAVADVKSLCIRKALGKHHLSVTGRGISGSHLTGVHGSILCRQPQHIIVGFFIIIGHGFQLYGIALLQMSDPILRNGEHGHKLGILRITVPDPLPVHLPHEACSGNRRNNQRTDQHRQQDYHQVKGAIGTHASEIPLVYLSHKSMSSALRLLGFSWLLTTLPSRIRTIRSATSRMASLWVMITVVVL